MKKILYISSVGSHWGSEESLFILIQSLRRQCYLHVYTVEGHFQKKLDQFGFPNSVFISYTLTKKEMAKFFYTALYFAYIARRGRFSIIHANDIHSGQFASISAKLAGIPSVIHIRSPLLKGWIDRQINRRLLDLCDTMIAVSGAVKEELISLGFDNNKIVVIPNAVDLRKFTPNALNRSVEAVYDLPKTFPVIGILGRISPLKGQRYLITAIPQLLEEWPDLKVLIVGDDHSSGNTEKEYLSALIKRVNVLESVRFIPHTSNVSAIISILDVLVVPSLVETFGRVIIEAMAMKVPVVASKVGGIPEIIKDGKNGLLIPPKDPDAISKAVMRLLTEKELYYRIANEGRYTVERKYLMESHGQDILQLYSRLLNDIHTHQR